MKNSPRIYLVGVEPEGVDPHRPPLSGLLQKTCLVIGGKRHIDPLRDQMGSETEFLPITANIPEVIERLKRFLKADKAEENAIVLATGDPLYYGIGTPITKDLPPESLVIIPATTLVQRAFSLLREPWDKVRVGSLHSKKDSPAIVPGRWAFYTGGPHGPADVCSLIFAKKFLIRNMSVLEEIGMEGERVRHFDRIDSETELPKDIKPLNMVVLTIEGAANHGS